MRFGGCHVKDVQLSLVSILWSILEMLVIMFMLFMVQMVC